MRRTPERQRWTRAASICAACGIVLTIHAATLVVDDDGGTPWQSIQSAIEDASPGDEVFVRCGLYVENVLLTNGVSLRGEHPRCAILDGGRLGTTLRTTGTLPKTIEKLTIRHGETTGGGANGIEILSGSPTITRNVIADNGIEGATPYAYGLVGYYGGISVPPGSQPVISHNVIRGNSGILGGGIGMLAPAGATVTSNLIAGNVGYFGGGVYVSFGEAELVNNTIFGNAAGYAGGLWVYNADLVLTNNVVVGNEIAGFGSAGGIYTVGPATVLYVANDFFGNLFGDGIDPAEIGTKGNISEDPRFVDTTSVDFAGFQPRSDSPLIDAGNEAGAPATDLRGVPLPVDGDADGTGLPDIGARENEGVTGFGHDGAVFRWDPARPVPPVFNVYRGRLAALRSTGAYTQDPALEPAATQFCGIGAQLADAEAPLPGEVWFYLVTVLGPVEGTLGFDGALVERPLTMPCPP